MVSRVWLSCISITAVLAVLAASAWRPQAQNAPDPGSNGVQLLRTGEQPRPDPSDRGATYYWLEARAVRATTRFADAVAVTERVAGGDLKTRILDVAGNELAGLAIDRMETASDVIEFSRPDGTRVRAAGRPGFRPTLDWGNRQAYALWKDAPSPANPSLEWRDGLMRARPARGLDVDGAVTELRTEWPDGLAAVVGRTSGARRGQPAGRERTGFRTRLTKDNLEVGAVRWYSEDQVLVWSFPGLTEGGLDPERLHKNGGWSFIPDMPWINIQSYAFHYFHSLVAEKGFVARAERRDRWIDKLVNVISPTLHAEVGCDGLHWLDYSVYRPCCDIHDRCYEKAGCSSSSWWSFWSSWSCTACNAFVVFCFSAGGSFIDFPIFP
jgi:hypothetical protein